jgi:hypothetical protein
MTDTHTEKNTAGDVHVMPNSDPQHVAMVACWCWPVEDEKTKRLKAQGYPTARVWVHQRPS